MPECYFNKVAKQLLWLFSRMLKGVSSFRSVYFAKRAFYQIHYEAA